MTMMPWLPTTAQALWILVPRKYRLSATLAGSACHVSLAGVGRGVARAAAPAAGAPGGCRPAGGGMQRRRKVPAHSVPAATLAAARYASTVVGAVCADAIPMVATKATVSFLNIHLLISRIRRYRYAS